MEIWEKLSLSVAPDDDWSRVAPSSAWLVPEADDWARGLVFLNLRPELAESTTPLCPAYFFSFFFWARYELGNPVIDL